MEGVRAEDEDPAAAGRLSFLGRELAQPFQRRVFVIPGGGRRPYDADDWRDSLVVIERGEVELETLDGRRRRLRAGAVLWLAGLPLRALHNPGRQPAIIVAVSRDFRCDLARARRSRRE